MRFYLRVTTNGHWFTATWDSDHASFAHVVTTRGAWAAAWMLAEKILGKGRFWFTMIRRGFYFAEPKGQPTHSMEATA